MVEILIRLLPGGVWVVWWLWGVNWQKTWPVLASGAWVPLTLILYVVALVWSLVAPISAPVAGLIPNFWWQLLCIAALAGVALFCGWIQGLLGWTPPEIAVEPAPAHGHDHGHGEHHGHGHGHHEAATHHSGGNHAHH
jgi:hypothetical protein